jgi:hypothetical protein
MQMQPGVCRHGDARKDVHGRAPLAIPEDMLVIDVNIVHALAVT